MNLSLSLKINKSLLSLPLSLKKKKKKKKKHRHSFIYSFVHSFIRSFFFSLPSVCMTYVRPSTETNMFSKGSNEALLFFFFLNGLSCSSTFNWRLHYSLARLRLFLPSSSTIDPTFSLAPSVSQTDRMTSERPSDKTMKQWPGRKHVNDFGLSVFLK